MDAISDFADDMMESAAAPACSAAKGPSLLPVPPPTPAPTASSTRIQAYPC